MYILGALRFDQSCRYLFQHGYNLSLVDLVDKIATPHVKKYLSDMTFKPLNVFPSPRDYADILDNRALPSSCQLWLLSQGTILLMDGRHCAAVL